MLLPVLPVYSTPASAYLPADLRIGVMLSSAMVGTGVVLYTTPDATSSVLVPSAFGSSFSCLS